MSVAFLFLPPKGTSRPWGMGAATSLSIQGATSLPPVRETQPPMVKDQHGEALPGAGGRVTGPVRS